MFDSYLLTVATGGGRRQQMNVVRIERVYKDYLLGEQKVQALKDITLAFEPGVFLAIAGPSGSGKTTLLNLIGCIDTPTSGRIYVNDQDVSGKTPDQLADLRAHTIGFIFQTFNLFPVLSAAENVEYPLLHRKDLAPGEREQRVNYFLDMVGLSNYARHRPNQLSGGQRQRVAIARALAIKPAIVLADEPTANLDHQTGNEILMLMKRINRKFKTTFVFSTHDERVMSLADRLVCIEDGEIARLGKRKHTRWSFVANESTRLASNSASSADTTMLDERQADEDPQAAGAGERPLMEPISELVLTDELEPISASRPLSQFGPASELPPISRLDPTSENGYAEKN